MSSMDNTYKLNAAWVAGYIEILNIMTSLAYVLAVPADLDEMFYKSLQERLLTVPGLDKKNALKLVNEYRSSVQTLRTAITSWHQAKRNDDESIDP